jgi:hypothetical protein
MEVPPKMFRIFAEQPSDKADNVEMETICRYAHTDGWQGYQSDDAINKIGRVVGDLESLGGHVTSMAWA